MKVKFVNAGEQVLEFSLVKENGLWRIASLEPLKALAGE